MTHRKYSILAIYVARHGDPLIRHIADVSTDTVLRSSDPLLNSMVTKAERTMPAEANYLMGISVQPAGEPGYAENMSEVNVGIPGYPA